MAQTGSYAITIFDQSDTLGITAFICFSQTSAVLPALRSSSCSPMQNMTLRPFFSAISTFVAQSSSVSPKSERRSEWPTITHWSPKSSTIPTETSPVKAPSAVLLMFCTPIAMDLVPPRVFVAAATWTVGGKITVSTTAGSGPKSLNAARSSETFFSKPVDFQLPPTTGFRNMPFFGQPTVLKSSPAYEHREPSSSSMRNNWLYLASLSERQGAPVLISPVRSPTTRSAMNESSVSPERCDTMTPQPAY
mmetsp:Transcript_63378/g.204284  ORF Transcript_63378/g.204284 Transcript_63378/m.204284 type:complete len:249 (+) Transcript_63378:352-1098(+)